MNKGGHLAIGFIVGILGILLTNKFLGWFNILDFKSWIIYIIIIFIYALLADIDHKMSSITWLFIGIGVIGIIASIIVDTLNNQYMLIASVILLGLTYIAAELFPHRGPTHTIWFAALTIVPIYLIIGWQEAILAFAVYYSHLAADGEWFKIRI